MTTTTTRLLTTCAAAALALGLTACSGTAAPTAPTAPVASAVAEATDSEDGSATADDESAAAGTKVSANTASEDEIAAALESAGVSNADRWAEEVVEYRPYPADDPNLTELRDNLAKYNPGQETTDLIVSALAP